MTTSCWIGLYIAWSPVQGGPESLYITSYTFEPVLIGVPSDALEVPTRALCLVLSLHGNLTTSLALLARAACLHLTSQFDFCGPHRDQTCTEAVTKEHC